MCFLLDRLLYPHRKDKEKVESSFKCSKVFISISLIMLLRGIREVLDNLLNSSRVFNRPLAQRDHVSRHLYR